MSEAEHCVYNCRRGGMECRNCGAFEEARFPLELRAFADAAGEFIGQHRECVPVPRRIRLSRAAGWRMPENTVKVDRSTPWGNPFVPGAPPADLTLYECLAKFERHALTLDLAPLRGKNLACWCKEGQPCHADILLRMANEPVPVS